MSDLPIPTLPDHDSVLVQINSSGICGSDLHTYGGHGFVPSVVFSLGHEGVGRIIEAGSNVRTVRTGDRGVVAIYDSVSDDAAGLLTDNLPTGWYAARQADVSPGATVAVIGLGPVGAVRVDLGGDARSRPGPGHRSGTRPSRPG